MKYFKICIFNTFQVDRLLRITDNKLEDVDDRLNQSLDPSAAPRQRHDPNHQMRSKSASVMPSVMKPSRSRESLPASLHPNYYHLKDLGRHQSQTSVNHQPNMRHSVRFDPAQVSAHSPPRASEGVGNKVKPPRHAR